MLSHESGNSIIIDYELHWLVDPTIPQADRYLIYNITVPQKPTVLNWAGRT
jgi:hypothetical protein